MIRFPILWSLISPLCASLIGGVIWFYQLSWYPGYPNLPLSIAIYLSYWLLLGILQAALLFWKFHSKPFAYQWFITTSATGFVSMLLHDLTLISIGSDTRGQGALILLLSLPILAIVGGLLLAFAQWRLVRIHDHTRPGINFNAAWLTAGVVSWVIGFIGGFFSSAQFPAFLLLITCGTALKGLLLQRHLQIP